MAAGTRDKDAMLGALGGSPIGNVAVMRVGGAHG